MSSNCPDCGAEVELSAAEAKVLLGSCAACGHGFTVLAGVRPTLEPGGEARAQDDDEAEDGAGATGGASSTVECAECGELAQVRSAGSGRLEAVCEDCGTVALYTLQRPRAEPEDRPSPPGRRPAGSRGFDAGRPASRPCRECGGPLRFETAPDGTMTGICDGCGNRFTLRPRAREGGYDRRGQGRPQRFGRRQGWAGRGGRSGERRFEDRPRDTRRKRYRSD